jgi:hypothetical protein
MALPPHVWPSHTFQIAVCGNSPEDWRQPCANASHRLRNLLQRRPGQGPTVWRAMSSGVFVGRLSLTGTGPSPRCTPFSMTCTGHPKKSRHSICASDVLVIGIPDDPPYGGPGGPTDKQLDRGPEGSVVFTAVGCVQRREGEQHRRERVAIWPAMYSSSPSRAASGHRTLKLIGLIQ